MPPRSRRGARTRPARRSLSPGPPRILPGRMSRTTPDRPTSRVRRCCCQHPLPSGLYGRLSTHTAQASDNVPSGTRLPHWSWGQPERYCDRAGYRDDFGGASRTSGVIATPPTDLLRLLRRLTDGPRPPTPGGSGLAFARSDVAIGSTPIRPITGRRSLPPPSFTRSPVGAPRGGPTLAGGLRAYHVASRERAWVRSRLYAGGASSAPGEFGAPGPGHVPFWSEPISTFGSSLITALAAVHLG